MIMHSAINDCLILVIPAKAGIQKEKELDARLRTSGMTIKCNMSKDLCCQVLIEYTIKRSCMQMS